MKKLLYQCANCDYQKVLPAKDGYGCPKCGGYFRPISAVPLTSVNLSAPPKQSDPVNSPTHYTSGGIETIDFIEAKKLNFHMGNAVKYISRAGKKDPLKYIEDLDKAIWFLEREKQRYEKENT